MSGARVPSAEGSTLKPWWSAILESHDPRALPASSRGDAPSCEAASELTVPVLAEELEVGVRTVERERVRLNTSVSSRAESVDVPLVREELIVERIPVGRVVGAPAAPRQEGDTLVVPVYEEVLVVEKRLVLREEVRITRARHQQRHRETVNLRREDVTIARLPGRATPKT